MMSYFHRIQDMVHQIRLVVAVVGRQTTWRRYVWSTSHLVVSC